MDDPRRFLPLTPQQFHILLALTDGHLHGYAIIRDVADRTGGTVRLGTGTLYTALARLEALALVEESDRRAAAVGRRRAAAVLPADSERQGGAAAPRPSGWRRSCGTRAARV